MAYTFRFPIIAVASLLSCYAWSAVIINDNFNDGVFDTSTWNSSLPFTDSSFSESGGVLTLNNRPIISTVAQIGGNIAISGSLMATRYDTLRVLTRSDLGVGDNGTNAYNELNGIYFSFHFDSNSVQIYDSKSSHELGLTSYNFNTGQWYDFLIADDGANLSFSINGTQLLTGVSNNSFGNYVSFYNRGTLNWSIPSTTQLDNVQITGTLLSAPEPSRGVLLLISASMMVCRRRRRFY